MKKTLKLIPALAMLLVSAILVSTSTYAWFSMNNKVTVTGMTVKTVVSDNLLISDDVIGSTDKNADSTFVNTLTQNLSAYLEPTSTTDGKNFWYTSTSNVQADGDAITDTYIDYNTTGIAASADTTYANNFSMNYNISKDKAATYNSGTGITANAALGYIDYVFQLKALNTSGSAQYINLTKLDLIYNKATDASKAYRVAVFAQKYNSTDKFSGAAGTLTAIYTANGAANFTPGEAVLAASGTTHGTVSYVTTTPVAVATVAQSATEYYKVVVRLWLEGEDTTCNNETFMALTDEWALNLELKLESATTNGVKNIAKYTSAAVGGTTYYYDGTDVWDDINKIGVAGDKMTTISNDIKTAFGIPTT